MKRGVMAAVGVLACAMAQAQVAQADVDHWTKNYDGAELVQGVSKCADPVIPEISKTNRDIKEVIARFNAWNTCYESAVNQLGLDKDPVSHIPAPVRFGMTVEQYQQAQKHMDEVYAGAVAAIGKQVTPVMDRFAAWRGKTEEYVTTKENDRAATAALAELVSDQRKKAGVARWGIN